MNSIRQLLETTYRGLRLYLLTTQGHVHVGIVKEVGDSHVQLLAPDGSTIMHISLADISGLRLCDALAEEIL